MELFGRDFASCKCYGSFCSWKRWIRPSGHQKPWRRNAIVTLDGGLQKSLNSEIPDWRTWVTWKRCKSHQKSSDEETQANMFNEKYSLRKSKWNFFFPPETIFYGINCCNRVLLREEPQERKFWFFSRNILATFSKSQKCKKWVLAKRSGNRLATYIISCFRNSLFPEESFVWQEIKSSTQSPRTGGFQLNPISTEIPIDSVRELYNRFFLLLFDAKKWRGEVDHPSFQKVNGCNSCDEKGPFGTPLSFFCLRSRAIQDVKSLRISISYYIVNV